MTNSAAMGEACIFQKNIEVQMLIQGEQDATAPIFLCNIKLYVWKRGSVKMENVLHAICI